MDDYIKSGEICKKVREYGVSLLKEGAKFVDIAEKIEEKIIELGGKPAFPVDIGIGYMAAHDSPRFNDARILKNGDLVKLDIGVHVNGAVSDTAVTVEIGSNKHEELTKCAEEALKLAIEIAKPGVRIREIGRVIQKTIQDFGFLPIVNLSGHGVDLYEIHTKPSIPNYDNGDNSILKEGQVIAIEPFATIGEGKVVEGKPSGIYEFVNDKSVRDQNARKILGFVKDEYRTLPFSERWLIRRFGNIAKLALLLLEREGIIRQFNILPEISKGEVAQAERTLIVGTGVIN